MGSGVDSGVGSDGGDLGWGELVPLNICFMWPLTVASVLGNYLATSSAVNPGQEVNALLLMDFMKVLLEGLKHAAW